MVDDPMFFALSVGACAYAVVHVALFLHRESFQRFICVCIYCTIITRRLYCALSLLGSVAMTEQGTSAAKARHGTEK